MAGVKLYFTNLITIAFCISVLVHVIENELSPIFAIGVYVVLAATDFVVAFVAGLLKNTGRRLYELLCFSVAPILQGVLNTAQAPAARVAAPPRQRFPPLERTQATTATGAIASFPVIIAEDEELDAPNYTNHWAALFAGTFSVAAYLAGKVSRAGATIKRFAVTLFLTLVINLWILIKQALLPRRRRTSSIHVARTDENTAAGAIQSFPINTDDDVLDDEDDKDTGGMDRQNTITGLRCAAFALISYMLRNGLRFVTAFAAVITSSSIFIASMFQNLWAVVRNNRKKSSHVPRTAANTATGALQPHALLDINEDEDDEDDQTPRRPGAVKFSIFSVASVFNSFRGALALVPDLLERALVFFTVLSSRAIAVTHLLRAQCVRCLGLFVRLVVASFMPVFSSCKRFVTRCCNIFNNTTATEHVQPDESEDAAQQPADRRPSRFSETFSITVDVVAKGAQSIRALADTKMPDQFIAIGKAIGILKSDGIKSVHIPRTAENTATGALASYSLFLTQPVAVDADGDAVLDLDDDDLVPLMVPARAKANPFKSVVDTVACAVLAAAIPHMLNGQLPRVRRSARRGVADRIALAASRG